MQTPAATAARPSHRGYVACLSAALATLPGHAAGAELSEDALLDGLTEAGLITYPSPPLGGALGQPSPIERLFAWLLGRLRGLLPWWLRVRLQELSPPHRLRVRLSAALAQELAGSLSPNTK